MDIWLGDGDWDLITFNFGIHDRRASDAAYEKRLVQIVKRLKATDAKLVWVNTTPVPEGANEYVAGAVDRLNKVAAAIMKEQNIPVLDMNRAITPLLAQYQLPENCHFKEEGYQFMGKLLADKVLAELPSSTENSQ
ncbi:SGNH/GDSL hydrolase family protein [Coraliomargarita algicola]|uniref:SGNH/GDSL hydrolase family protein n=1 Tax=Coraliomargarita algicola TaxID=3092156 RepID=A0ABZ0RLY8_9BACT|nr:SGNH/GDSL hydrolase family protein [Coraliomargarita sp. J2-16]WPJ96249.1 SGNH/GDSL hydrolase family protein [Coraliomargarita sp. J2-16]